MLSLTRSFSMFGTQKASPLASTPSQDTQHQSIINSFRAQVKSGVSGVVDTSFLAGVVNALAHENAIDDRKMLLEHVLTLLSHMPEGRLSKKLQDSTIKILYNDLPHPASTYVGQNFAWRTADGSGNNVALPNMGKAGTPYSRSVMQTHPIPEDSLPDPGLVFDTLLKRDGFVAHPAGLSSMMFSFAALVIHTCFRTSHRDVNINETSSYVDLAPLYGNNQADQDKIRVRDGRGLLFPDIFAEDRLLLLPPAVCVILVLFSRNHNYIARKILEINERGTYVDPDSLSPSDPTKTERLLAQEEEIFQIARLVNCGWFAAVVFSDYLSCILGLIRDGNTWILNPFGEMRVEDHSMFERGQGNVCSVEFNCLYRWHATTSQEDEKWVEKVFDRLFEGKKPEQITPLDFKATAQKLHDTQPDIHHWTFGNLQRQADGTFKDSELANYIKNATDHPAAAFRARGTPAVMRLHEIMGIEQNRRWGVCSLNDFRKFLGLKTYASFKEWNPDPAIYEAAERLYGNIERLELYVGLQAEQTKPVVEGAGLCPGYTISRAILSDAIALTRGDRFYTSDFTPYNLTAWGFNDCQRQSSGAGFGSTLGRLFLRTLPNDFSHNSVYTWFPLMIPTSMKTHLSKMNLLNKYDMARPDTHGKPMVIEGYHEVLAVLKDTANFHAPYAARAATVIKGDGFFLASADVAQGEKEQAEVLAALVQNTEDADGIGRFFFNTTRDLITSSSFTLVGGKSRCVDIVRDVFKCVPLHWAATEIAGIQLKTKGNPAGVYTPEQLFDMLSDIYSYLFLATEPYKLLVLEDKVKRHVQDLLRHIKGNLTNGSQRKSIYGIVDTISGVFSKGKKTERHEFLKRLHNYSTSQLANVILAIMVGFSVELSLALTNVLNVYLGSAHGTEFEDVISRPEAKNQLHAHIFEALRIDPPLSGVHRVAQKDITVGPLNCDKDQRLYLNIRQANNNETVFENPVTVVTTRKAELYLHTGLARCLGTELTCKVIGEVFRAVYALPNVHRALGQSGQLTRYLVSSEFGKQYSYLDKAQLLSPWPTSMVIQYDA